MKDEKFEKWNLESIDDFLFSLFLLNPPAPPPPPPLPRVKQ